MPDFKRRMEWFIDNRPDLIGNMACMRTPGRASAACFPLQQNQLRRILKYMLDENEFSSGVYWRMRHN